MSAQMTTKELRSTFGLKTSASKRSQEQWQNIFFADVMDSRIRMGLDRRAGEMLYGITHAYKTGRLTAAAEMNLRNMSAYKFAQLLVSVMSNCSVMGDVPAFLNK